MLSKIVGLICVISFIWAIFTGNLSDLTPAILDASGKAVGVTLSLVGAMTLWSGIMELLREAGAIRIMSKAMRPLTRLLFPEAARTGKGLEPAVACLAANLLGIGNAATPLGISALQEMQSTQKRSENSTISPIITGDVPNNFSVSDKSTAYNPTITDDAMMLTVLCTSSFSLVPTTILTLRRAAGALVIFEIIPKIWLCGLIGVTVSVISTKICQKIFKPKRKRQA